MRHGPGRVGDVVLHRDNDHQHDRGNQFVMPAQDVLLVAEFELATYAINIPEVENGTVTADATEATIVGI